MANQLVVLTYKDDVDHTLNSTLESYARTVSLTWTGDTVQRLLPFTTAGKSIRGSLVCYIYRMFKSELLPFVVRSAASLELIHAGLLIHDDIMDRDPKRRGADSLYVQYRKFGDEHGATDSKQFGDSEAINLGDFCYFLGFELLAPELLPLVSRELTTVALAQMQDVAGGFLKDKLTKEQVLSIYRYKTARYSFSLPMKMGAVLAKAPESVIRSLDQIGEHIGLLFQIRDDELNILGDTTLTGKTTGTDHENGKQTLASFLNSIELQKLKEEQENSAKHLIGALPLWADQKAGLTELLQFSMTREK